MGTAVNASEAALSAELNDLLQLDHDAVQAYALAIAALENLGRREALTGFKGDHERHIEELSVLIKAHGGTPVELPHLPTGPMKLAVQGLGDLGDDRAVLLAFKSNERLSRDKYQRASSAEHPADVRAVLTRAAADEARHYAWAASTLDAMGAGESTTVGRAEHAFEVAHTKAADVIEGAEREVMYGAEAFRQNAMRAFGRTTSQLAEGGVRNVWIALGVGFVAAQLFGGAEARRRRDSIVARERLAELGRRDRLDTYDATAVDVRKIGRSTTSPWAATDTAEYDRA